MASIITESVGTRYPYFSASLTTKIFSEEENHGQNWQSSFLDTVWPWRIVESETREHLVLGDAELGAELRAWDVASDEDLRRFEEHLE